MKITITRRQNFHVTLDGQDDIPEFERVSLEVKPMSLAMEEEMTEIAIRAARDPSNLTSSNIAAVNRAFRTHVVGWKNVVGDGGAPVEARSYMEGGVLSDDAVLAFKLDHRLQVFNELVSQAGLHAEVSKEKS